MSRIKVTVEADGMVIREFAGDSFSVAVAGVADGEMDACIGGELSAKGLVFLLAKSVANVVRLSRSLGLDALSIVEAGLDGALFLAGAADVATEAVEIDDRGGVSRTVRGGR